MRTSLISRIARPALAQAAAARTVQRSAPLSTLVTRPSVAAQPSLKAFQQLRFASGSALNKDDIQSRILEVLKSFEKVDPAKVGCHGLRLRAGLLGQERMAQELKPLPHLARDVVTLLALHLHRLFLSRSPCQVAANSSFTSDLGLDSLDAVEVVMAIEEEFSIEIPDEEVRQSAFMLWPPRILAICSADASCLLPSGRRHHDGRASYRLHLEHS